MWISNLTFAIICDCFPVGTIFWPDQHHQPAASSSVRIDTPDSKENKIAFIYQGIHVRQPFGHVST